MTIGTASSTCGLMSRPKATTTPSSTPASSTSSTLLVTGRPSSSAAAFTGLGSSPPPATGACRRASPRAARRSRRRPALAAAGRHRRRAEEGEATREDGKCGHGPARTATGRAGARAKARCLGPCAGGAPSWQPCAGSSSRCSSSSTPSRWSSSCWNSRASSSSASIETSLPSRSTPDEVDLLRAHDLEREAGHREAALVVDPLAPRLLITGLMSVRGPVADVVDEEPLLHADLRRGQPEPGRVVHRGQHVVGEAGEPAVDLGDLGGTLLQAPGRRRAGSRTEPCHQANGRVLFSASHTRSGSTSMRTRAVGRGVRANASASSSGVVARTSHVPSAGPEHLDAVLVDAENGASGARRSDPPRPAPTLPPSRRPAGSGGRVRRCASAAATRSGSACKAASRTSWFGHAGLHEHPRPGRRPPTSRAARASRANASSAAR